MSPPAATTAATGRASISAIAATGWLGPRFIYVHRAATQLGAVQVRDGGLRSLGIAHFDESETAGLARVTIRNQIDALDGAIGLKSRLKVCLVAS